MKNHWLVFDISNMLHRTFYKERNESIDTLIGLASHTALVSLNSHFKKHKPTRVIMVFDRSSWRKEFTSSGTCFTKKAYKGNRRQEMTPQEAAKYEKFKEHMREFETLISDYTAITTMSCDRLEADDLIGGICQYANATGDTKVTVISTDSDFWQFKRYSCVKLVSPASDKEVELEDYNGDPLLYLFSKCLRGDRTDNIQSAFPRVQAKRIQLAYSDPYERVKLMKEKWKDKDGDEFLVEDLYNENVKLIDLTAQPDDIKALINQTVATEIGRAKTASMFHILKFVGKHKLERIKESIDLYLSMMSLVET